MANDLKLLIRIRADIQQALGEMKKMTGELDKQGSRSRVAARQSGKLAGSYQTLAAAAATYASVATLIKGIRLADEFATLQQRIKTATKETGDYNAVSRETFEISQRNGAALLDTVSTFQRLSIARAELGATNSELLQVTEAVQQLGIQSGATATAMQAGQLQFAQAMSAGVVRAEELNSIIENMPAVAERIARGMDKTVGGLRKAVLEGSVLSRDVFNSLLRQAPEIAREMEDIPLSLSRASVKLENSMGNFLSKLDQATGPPRHWSFCWKRAVSRWITGRHFSMKARSPSSTCWSRSA